MDSLITLILLGIFISKVLKKAEKKRGKPSVKKTVLNQTRPAMPQYGSGTTYQSNAQRNAYSSADQQRATKERLQRKYGSQSKPVQKSDILARAKENVRENEQSQMQKELHAEVCREYRDSVNTAMHKNEHSGMHSSMHSSMHDSLYTSAYGTTDVLAHKVQSVSCDSEGESDILKRVNDLMVMGYSGNLKFERDFIAEGVDMLNRFSL